MTQAEPQTSSTTYSSSSGELTPPQDRDLAGLTQENPEVEERQECKKRPSDTSYMNVDMDASQEEYHSASGEIASTANTQQLLDDSVDSIYFHGGGNVAALMQATPIPESDSEEDGEIRPEPMEQAPPAHDETLGSQAVVVAYHTQYRTPTSAGAVIYTSRGEVVGQQELNARQLARADYPVVRAEEAEMSVTEEHPAEVEPQPQPTIPQGIKNRHAKKRKRPVDDNQSNVAGSSDPSAEDGELPASPQSKTPTSSVVLDGRRMTPQQAMQQLMLTQAQASSPQVDENQPPVLTANVSTTGSLEEQQVLQR